MAAINDLISQIQDETLRNRIQEEVSKMAKQKKFGLVFEEHMPESTPLYDMPIKSGCNVMRRDSKDDKSIYVVLKVEDDTAVCVKPEQKDETVTFELKDIVRVAEFGEPIYPYLKPLDSVCNAPDSDLWHTLIEADNYHALQLLEYLYAGKVDCIYIDPPYNTGAKDWKYNNDYVDGADAYRHSKWLSFMQRRLQLAKKLLNPAESVLIVTIDEKEYLHLGCLLEEIFPEANMQMVSSVINPAGVSRHGAFARVDEYIYIIRIGTSEAQRVNLSDEWRIRPNDKRATMLRWNTLIRTGTNVRRSDRKNLFYPIFVREDGKAIHSVGEPYYGTNLNEVQAPEGTVAIWPIRSNGEEGNWQIANTGLMELAQKGYVHLGRFTETGMAISYLKKGEIKKIESGAFEISGYAEDGSVMSDTVATELVPGTQWRISSHDATLNGTKLLNSIIGEKRFTFPKSLYAVHDTIRFFVANKPNALIVDFFAGSGTTMHAVNLLNAEDGGHRRCIMVTNNEVSADEAKMLKDKGYQPGDAEWEKLGIAHYVTWPRTVCSIKGQDVNGNPLKGDYLGSEPPMHMADGFKANAAFFKLGFLDPTAVSLGMRISEMLPTLWLKTGAKGKCPELTGEQVPDMLILPENQFAVLINENTFADFAEKLAEHPEIQTVFLATDYEVNYQSMVKNLNVENAYQLYQDYLDHFRVNRGRN
ncbi:site-specific DNA-methyltransferase [Faecalibacterium prausnitzii]|jgi:adenine-specific DNA-methyltransferase|uniref:site-specific DNA-methyltransferase n=1 Tax=Faecalibacterium prausnitzii TaxID=853 RepID=UPI003A7FE023